MEVNKLILGSVKNGMGLSKREVIYWMNVVSVSAKNNVATPSSKKNFKKTLESIA